MTYGVIAQQGYPVDRLCDLVGVSRSGYYAWRQRAESRRVRANQILVGQMHGIHREVKRRYGSPRMHRELAARGYRCGRNRVARLMRRHGIIAKMTMRFRKARKAGHGQRVAPNLLARQFTVLQPDRVWAADITYIPTRSGFVYLAVVLDLYSRRVVGWAMQNRLGADLVTAALIQAYERRRPQHGVLHHSDRDPLYRSLLYQHRLQELAMTPSMSRHDNCWDNACVESFFGSLKNELMIEKRFLTRDEAQTAVFE